MYRTRLRNTCEDGMKKELAVAFGSQYRGINHMDVGSSELLHGSGDSGHC